MTVRQYVPHMNEKQKWLAGTAISLATATILIPTVIGAIVFGVIALGCFGKYWEVRTEDDTDD